MNTNLYNYFLIFILPFALALLLVPLIRKLAFKLKAVDLPNQRKIHQQPVARLGGVAIFLSALLGLTIFYFLSDPQFSAILAENAPHLIKALIPGLVILTVGIIDDLRRLRAIQKLAAEIAVGLACYYLGFYIEVIPIPWNATEFITLGVLSPLATVIWFVAIINVINIIDGLDGLAAGVCFFALLAIFMFSALFPVVFIALLAACLVGSILGFLRYNFYPASIFLGDSGSLFLCFWWAFFALLGRQRSASIAAISICLISLGIPIIDTILATLRRYFSKVSVFKADRQHIHHRLLELGFTQKWAVIFIYIVCVLLSLSSLIIVYTKDMISALTICFVTLLLIVSLRIAGYLNLEKFSMYLHPVKGMPITFPSRTFYNSICGLREASTMETIWENLRDIIDYLEFDYLELHYVLGEDKRKFYWHRDNPERQYLVAQEGAGGPVDSSAGLTGRTRGIDNWQDRRAVRLRNLRTRLSRVDGAPSPGKENLGDQLLVIDLPIFAIPKNGFEMRIRLKKDIRENEISYDSLRKVEFVRRNLEKAMAKVEIG